MPQPRDCHGAETFAEAKVLILGGQNDNDVLDSMLEFDPEKNECKELPSLPHPMHNMQEMATVCWRDQVVLLGGRDKDDQVLNDVFMYDCKTGIGARSLPYHLCWRRDDCCAVYYWKYNCSENDVVRIMISDLWSILQWELLHGSIFPA
jgi:hypothetical protein